MVTESLAHAHLAGTSFRPDRLQIIADEAEDELSSFVLVLILLVGFFDLVAPEVLLIAIFSVLLFEIFDDEAAFVDDNLVTAFRLRIVLTLRFGCVVAMVGFFAELFFVS